MRSTALHCDFTELSMVLAAEERDYYIGVKILRKKASVLN